MTMIKHTKIPGLGFTKEHSGMIELDATEDSAWRVGKQGVIMILTPHDKKVEFIIFENKTLANVKSKSGYPAIYPVSPVSFEGPAQAVLMDLDGTSVQSEGFWMWIIEQTTGRLLGNPRFALEAADEPHVSGHSVFEHLQYCINKYCPDKNVEEARQYYFEITHQEMNKISRGYGRTDAFVASPGLKEFLITLKANKIRIGLVTSGLYEKAWPEIRSVFETLDMGDPLDFYDAIISAGQTFTKKQTGTLGELSSKPHPWLYAETARVGLGIGVEERHRVIGVEDSAAGVVSVRLAGFSAIGMTGGNIQKSGVNSLLLAGYDNLVEALPLILGECDN